MVVNDSNKTDERDNGGVEAKMVLKGAGHSTRAHDCKGVGMPPKFYLEMPGADDWN